MAGKDENFGALAKRLTQRRAFFGGGDEEFAHPRARQMPRHPRRPQPIAVGLDHSAGFGAGPAERIKRAPVAEDCVEVDTEGCSSHGVFLSAAA